MMQYKYTNTVHAVDKKVLKVIVYLQTHVYAITQYIQYIP